MSNLVIIGAGQHAKVIYDLASSCGYQVMGYVDDNHQINESYFHSTIIGQIKDIIDIKERLNCKFIIAIGDNKKREEIDKNYNISYATLISPDAYIGSDVTIGKGSVILPKAIINTCSKIGRHVIINTGAIVEHDTIIEDYVHISHNATIGGNSRIGMKTLVDMGAIVKRNISVSMESVIDAGMVVREDIK